MHTEPPTNYDGLIFVNNKSWKSSYVLIFLLLKSVQSCLLILHWLKKHLWKIYNYNYVLLLELKLNPVYVETPVQEDK